MLRIIHLRTDIKQIMRDPIMLMMLIAPLLTILVFKLLVIFLTPYLVAETGFDASLYYPYVLSFVLLTNSGLLGIVTGFLMLDERDGKITELMAVTPLGRSGYLINRLSFISVLSVFYCITGIYVLDITELPSGSILILSVLSALYSAILGLLLFSGAEDKVKGLTFAKALNALMIFAFTDLFSLKWLIVLSWIFPPYWFSMIIKSDPSLLIYGIAMVIHLGWLGFLILNFWKKES